MIRDLCPVVVHHTQLHNCHESEDNIVYYVLLLIIA